MASSSLLTDVQKQLTKNKKEIDILKNKLETVENDHENLLGNNQYTFYTITFNSQSSKSIQFSVTDTTVTPPITYYNFLIVPGLAPDQNMFFYVDNTFSKVVGLNNDLNGFTIRNPEDYPGSIPFYMGSDGEKIKLVYSEKSGQKKVKYITTKNNEITLTNNANAYSPNVIYTVVNGISSD